MRDAHSEQWGFSQLRKLSLCVVCGDTMVHYHRGHWCPRVGGNHLQQRLSFTIHRRCRSGKNAAALTQDSLWRPTTVQRYRYAGFDIDAVYFVSGPLWPPHPRTTAWRFDVTEVIVDCSLLSASIFIRASHGTQKRERERQRLPFIATLIFLCDGWLSYCVICAFWKMLFGAEEITSFQIIQSSTVLWG